MVPHLPSELLRDIISLCLDVKSNRIPLLLTSSVCNAISMELLYTHLRFETSLQLIRFLCTYGTPLLPLPYPPRTIDVDFTSDATTIFFHLNTLITRCGSLPEMETDEQGRIVLDILRLRLYSHTQDSGLHMILTSLEQVNPRRFIWTGPDPPHHFSTAVSLLFTFSAQYLFRAIEGWTNLTHLTLTHISLRLPSGNDNLPFRFPQVPNLRVFYLGQATFIPAESIAIFILGSAGVTALEKVRLVDAYESSIWGRRLRRSDIETLAARIVVASDIGDDEQRKEKVVAGAVKKIRQFITCEGQTERIIGGDRIPEDSNGVLM
ncbi:hypothetical protein BDQ12DRAFT_701319 [Crucibulum laeve]|uniref:F-box domain-containing protein n=1 Tax=Crucibulum laeve TaxID=68775 RepID=A0A5C3LH15_9AGAR|nr:hypothetical protein BDQ12DRAFT_701319 [Crucibulum laeve]